MRRAGIFALLLLGRAASAADPFAFLNLGQGPRSLSEGGSGAARTDGRGDSAALNPAGPAWSAGNEAWSSYGTLGEGVRIGQAGLSLAALDHGTFAFQVLHLGHDPIDAYDGSDGRSGTISPSDTLLSATWAKELRRGLAAGATLKFFQEDLGAASASGQALDVGATYQFLSVSGLSAGLALRNWGPKAGFAEKEKLPSVLAAGLGYAAFSDRLHAALDVESKSGEDAVIRLGGEFWVRDILALRAGYRSGQDAGAGISGGMGFRLSSRLDLDYSYAPFGELGDVHRAALSFRFGGGKAQALYEEGVRELRKENYDEAVILFDKALTLDPTHAPAARQLKEAAEKLKSSLQQ